MENGVVTAHAGRRQPSPEQLPVELVQVSRAQPVEGERTDGRFDVPLDRTAMFPHGVGGARRRDVVEPAVHQVSYAACVAFGHLAGLDFG
jgi:hypothetical protein